MTAPPRRLQSTDRGQGPPVLMVHGQPGQGADWDAVAAALATEHRVLVPDRPGYGRTGGRAAGLKVNADALSGLLDEKGVSAATVVGHSLGGGVALALALGHGERVSGLVLVGSVGTRSSLGLLDRVLGLPGLGEGLAFAGWEVSRTLVPVLRRRSSHLPPAVGSRISTLPAPWVAQEASRRPAATTWRSFVIEQRALLAEIPSLEARLGEVSAPTAVVAGRRDRVVPPRAATDLARRIPGAELVWVPEAGHLVPQEAPAALAEVVRRYASRR